MGRVSRKTIERSHGKREVIAIAIAITMKMLIHQPGDQRKSRIDVGRSTKGKVLDV